MKTSRMFVQVSCVPLHTCQRCGITAPADRQFAFTAHTLEEAQHIIATQQAPRSGIPVGWASYTEGVWCDQCQSLREKTYVIRMQGLWCVRHNGRTLFSSDSELIAHEWLRLHRMENGS